MSRNKCTECRQRSSKRGMTRNDAADANAKLARYVDHADVEKYREHALEMKRRADEAQLELEVHQAECSFAIATAKRPTFATVEDDCAAVRIDLPPALELVAMMNAGATQAEIAEEYGCSPSTVSQRVRDSGIQRNRGGTGSKVVLPIEELVALRASGSTLDELAARYGCSTSAVRRNLDEAPLDLSFSGLPDVSWMDAGLCAQTDPEAFFPEKGGSTRDAKSVCAECPVQADCLDWALETQQRFGIWGGKSERERRRIATALAGENAPTAERVCALSECSVEIDENERPNKKFCTPEHAHRAAYLARTAS